MEYEYKNDTLPWPLFDEILSFENWSKRWRLGEEQYRSSNTSIHLTHHVTNPKAALYYTKVFKYKNKRQLIKIWQEFAMIKTLKILNYPDIGYGQNKGEIYLTMEILNYSLRIAIKENTNINLPYFILEIAANLHQLHSNNYIHLDIKASNCAFRDRHKQCLLSLGNGWKLIDFDTLKYLKNQSKLSLNGYIGTCGWTAPEMSPYATPKKPNIITTKTDIFSFGLLILFIVNGGEKLFALNENEKKQNLNKKDTTRSLYAKLMNFDMKYYLLKLYAIDGKIDGDLYDLLSKMLDYDQNKRISAIQIATHKYFKQRGLIRLHENTWYKLQNEKRMKNSYKKKTNAKYTWLQLIYKTKKYSIAKLGINRNK